MITSDVLQRVFMISYRDEQATAFIVDKDGRQYFVTARHVIKNMKFEDQIEISMDGEWKPFSCRLVGHAEGAIDISVFASDYVGRNMPAPLITTSAELTYSQDVFFLGYPYGLSFDAFHLNDGFPFPFAKRAIVSSLEVPPDAVIYLDGINNQGFSGGPVVFSPIGRPADIRVCAVISGYTSAIEKVKFKDKDSRYHVESNTGLIRSFGIVHALDVINRNPTGRTLP